MTFPQYLHFFYPFATTNHTLKISIFAPSLFHSSETMSFMAPLKYIIYEWPPYSKWKIVDLFVEKFYYFVQLSMHTVGKFMTKKIAKKLPYD